MRDKTKKRPPRFDDIIALSKKPPTRPTTVSPFALAYDAEEARKHGLDSDAQVVIDKNDSLKAAPSSVAAQPITEAAVCKGNNPPIAMVVTRPTINKSEVSTPESELPTLEANICSNAGVELTPVETGIPKTGVPNAGSHILGIPFPGVPISSKPALYAPAPQIYDTDIPCEGRPISGVPISGVPISGTPLSRKLNIRRALQVQDGHSLGEQLVLTTLWNNSSELPRKPYRRICIGYRTLSALCGLTVNNCKANLKSLEAKLAIETEIGYSTTSGTTYKVFPFTEILRRREAAGLTHVLRSKGASFVHPETGIPVSGIHLRPEPGIPDFEKGIPAPDKKGIPGTGTQIISKKEVNLKEQPAVAAVQFTSSAAAAAPSQPVSAEELAIIHKAAAKDLTVDDDAVRQIAMSCRAKDPSATVDEIAHFSQVAASQIAPQKNIGNPIGLLILKVPQFFPSARLNEYRRQRVEATAAEGRKQEQARETAQQILADPEANADAREWADRILAECGEKK